MSEDPAARVVLIGFGLAGSVFHAPLIAAEPRLELSAIVTSNAERSAQAVAAYPATEVIRDADDIWHRARNFDVAVIASPNRSHVPLAKAALSAGLNVVVDKPLAGSGAQARNLVERSGPPLLTVFQSRRWDGDFLTLRKLIADGQLGSVRRFESRFERWRPQVADAWRESADPEDAGGVLFDLGSHLIDQALQLFGPATHVYAELEARRKGALVDDDSFVALTHASGTVSHLSMSMTTTDFGPRMRAIGSAGAYLKFGLDGQEAALKADGDPAAPDWGYEPEATWGTLITPEQSVPVPTEPGNYPQFYERLAAAIIDGAALPVDPIEVVAVQRVIDAARESATHNSVIELFS